MCICQALILGVIIALLVLLQIFHCRVEEQEDHQAARVNVKLM